MLRQFDVVIERDEEGFYVASVPQIPTCQTQARSLDEITQRIREAIELYLDVEGAPEHTLEFVGIQRVTIPARAGFLTSPALSSSAHSGETVALGQNPAFTTITRPLRTLPTRTPGTFSPSGIPPAHTAPRRLRWRPLPSGSPSGSPPPAGWSATHAAARARCPSPAPMA